MSRKSESTQLEAEMVSLCKYPDHDDVQVILRMRGEGGGSISITYTVMLYLSHHHATYLNGKGALHLLAL